MKYEQGVDALYLIGSGRCSFNLNLVILKLRSKIYILNVSCEIALRWLPQYLMDD